MIVSRTTFTQPLLLFAAIAAAGLAVIVAGIYLFPLTIDEAYITYSHARNFARSGRLVYHPSNPEFSVSTPLYALLLGLGGAAGLPIPAMSKLLGAASIFGSSVYLSLLCYRHRMFWAAITAGLLLATSPLLWQTLGLEYCLFLLLVLAAFYHSDRGQFVAAAALMAGAVLTRWEGVFAAALLGLTCFVLFALRHGATQKEVTRFLVGTYGFFYLVWLFLSEYPDGDYIPEAIVLVLFAGIILYKVLFAEEEHILQIGLTGLYRHSFLLRRTGWKVVVVFVFVLAPVLLYGALANGTPVPMALLTQQGQGAVGFTGYGFGTSFLQGLVTMLMGWTDQSPLYYLWLPLSILGAHFLLSGRRQDADVSEFQDSDTAVAGPTDPQEGRGGNMNLWWIWGLVAWGVLHLAGSALLGLSPYLWSFVPLVPGAVILAGLALQRLSEWVGRAWVQVPAAGAILLLLFVAQLVSLDATISAINAPHPPAPVETYSGSTGRAHNMYRAAAEWLNANTPADTTVAASRSGIIGYYAERAIIDVSGSTQLDVAQALRRGDPFHAILVHMPEYLVLDESHFIFGIWQRKNPWFATHYHAAVRFTDEQAETLAGPSLVVLRRAQDVRPWDSATVYEDDRGYGSTILHSPDARLKHIAIYGSELLPGSWMHVKLDCDVEPARASSVYSERTITTFVLTGNNTGNVVAEQPLENAMTAYHSRRWREVERFPVYVQFFLPEGLAHGTYYFWVRHFDETTEDGVMVGYAKVTVGSSSNG